jgi:Tol biopolymer transport system component
MKNDGSNQVNISNSTYRERYPCWSPDNNKIIFVSNPILFYEIFSMNSDGSKRV